MKLKKKMYIIVQIYVLKEIQFRLSKLLLEIDR